MRKLTSPLHHDSPLAIPRTTVDRVRVKNATNLTKEQQSKTIIGTKLLENMHIYDFVYYNNKILNSKVLKFTQK